MRIAADLLAPVCIDADRRAEIAAHSPHEVTVRLLDRAVAFRVSDGEAARLLRLRYRAMSGAGTPAFIAYALQEPSGNSYFVDAFGTSFAWRHGPLTPFSLAFLVDAVGMPSFLAHLDDTVSLHAAALSDGVRAFALVGRSTAGKTTTALACARRGLTLYSDERCVVSAGVVRPFPRAMSLRGPGLALLLADGEAMPGRLTTVLSAHGPRDWNDAGFAELFGGESLPAPRPLHSIFAIAGVGRAPEARRITAGAMLKQILPGMTASSCGPARLVHALQMLRYAACYELTLGTPDETAQFVAERVAA